MICGCLGKESLLSLGVWLLMSCSCCPDGSTLNSVDYKVGEKEDVKLGRGGGGIWEKLG